MSNKKTGILIIVILLIGLGIAVFLSQRQSNINQQASGSVNLNKASTIVKTANSDGTMGPQTSESNYSNQLPADKTGSLAILITDPPEIDSRPAFPTGLPQVLKSDNISKSPSYAFSNGVQAVNSLVVKIEKAEVHLADADKWETLKMDFPISLDLVQLQKGVIAPLGVTRLSAGNYSEIRLYIANATAVLPDSSIKNLTLSGYDRIIKLDNTFTITPRKNTTLVIDFDAQKSVNYDGSEFNLQPFVSTITGTK